MFKSSHVVLYGVSFHRLYTFAKIMSSLLFGNGKQSVVLVLETKRIFVLKWIEKVCLNSFEKINLLKTDKMGP